MIQLSKARNAWGTSDFEGTLKTEIEQMGIDDLPLQEALSTSSYVVDKKISAMVIGASEEAGLIRAKVGIFYAGILGGCACADDPTPVNENSEYCVVQLDIDKATAETAVTLLPE